MPDAQMRRRPSACQGRDATSPPWVSAAFLFCPDACRRPQEARGDVLSAGHRGGIEDGIKDTVRPLKRRIEGFTGIAP